MKNVTQIKRRQVTVDLTEEEWQHLSEIARDCGATRENIVRAAIESLHGACKQSIVESH